MIGMAWFTVISVWMIDRIVKTKGGFYTEADDSEDSVDEIQVMPA